MNRILFAISILVPFTLFGQQTLDGYDSSEKERIDDVIEDEAILSYAEKMPEFPGGAGELFKFISSNIHYPELASNAGLQGTVYTQFVISKSGSVKDIKVLRGMGAGCDAEAIRVLELMPAWTPGMQSGKAVNVQFTLPIRFMLEVVEPKSTEVRPSEEEPEYTMAISMPSYPGGDREMYQFIFDNLEYPESAIAEGVEGKVLVEFEILDDGSIKNPTILKGIGGGCDEEAIRIVNLMPKWNAGIQEGKVVPIEMRLPISFRPPSPSKKK